MLKFKEFCSYGDNSEEAIENAINDANTFILNRDIEKSSIVGCNVQIEEVQVGYNARIVLTYWGS